MAVQVGLVAMPNFTLAELRLFLRLCRLLGVDSFLAADHWQDFTPQALWEPSVTWRATQSHSPHEYREAFTVLGNLAPSAGRIRLGTAVTEVLRRHPVMVAQAALTLAEATKRPPVIGVGAGERLNTEPYGLASPKPVGRLEEALRVIRLCWETSGPFDFEGEHFSLTGAVMDLPIPDSGTPEIWIAAHGPRMLRITGELGDGWIPSAPPLLDAADYETGWKTIRSAAIAAGRDPSLITPSLFASIIVAPSDSAAEAMLDTTLVKYWALMGSPARWWTELGLTHPLGPGYRGYVDILPEATDRATLMAAIERVPHEVVRSCFLYGTPNRIEARIRDYADAGLQHVVLAPASSVIRRRDFAYGVWALARLTRRLRR